MNSSIPAILTVLRSGGVYTHQYVEKLKNRLQTTCNDQLRFVCLTDVKEVGDICEVIPLKHDWEGWWSKIELFRPDLNIEKAIYFDLDTIILKDISKLVELVDRFPFMMLQGFNTVHGMHPASGIMCGDFSRHAEVYETFKKNPDECIQATQTKKGAGMKGDQGFIIDIVGYNIPYLQDHLPENYIIGKRMYNASLALVESAHILEWSGKPRLHENKELWEL